MMTDELKPCPFCGGDALCQTHRIAEDAEVAFVNCVKCGTQTEHFEDAYAPREEAIAAWNQRTAPTTDSTDLEARFIRYAEILEAEESRIHERRATNTWSEGFRTAADTLASYRAEIAQLRDKLARAREALGKDATRFECCASMISGSFNATGTLRAERTVKAKHFALEAIQALKDTAHD